MGPESTPVGAQRSGPRVSSGPRLSVTRPWLAFLSLATFMCFVCFICDARVQSLFWPNQRDTLIYWPARAPTLKAWELDTETSYSLDQAHLQAQRAREAEHVYEFEIREVELYLGERLRNVITVNNKFPGPLIEAVEGDTIRVRVKNRLEVSTSLHFHGITMNGTNFYDGVPGITQCGIGPGMQFEYVFKAEPAGTYWYHSHSGLQFVQGLLGPMVIHRRSELEREAPEQHVVLLNDLYREDPEDLMAVYREPWLGGDFEPTPDVALAQGKMYPRITTSPEGYVLLRLINAASNTAFNIQLGSPSHNFTVVEADGTLLMPAEVDSLTIFPSQRYTILVPIESKQWLFATPQFGFYDGNDHLYMSLKERSEGLRILIRNNSTDAALPSPPDPTMSYFQIPKSVLSEPYFEPLVRDSIPAPSVQKFLDLSMTRTSEGSVAGAINNEVAQFNEKGNILRDLFHSSRPLVPAGLHHRHSNSTFPFIFTYGGSPLITATNYTVLDILIRNFDDSFHPMHLHGHKFWILERGMLEKAEGENLRELELRTSELHRVFPDRPLKRDTVTVPQDEWVRIRVVLDNPGNWMLHCHIPWHSLSGMRTLIVSLPTELRSQEPLVPDEWWQLCSQHPQNSPIS